MKKRIDPKPGEVWWIVDEHVVMHDKGRKDKRKRPAIVLKRFSNNFILVIPLSTSVNTDFHNHPINSRDFKDINDDVFSVKQNSHAVLQLFQPVEITFFDGYCGCISSDKLYDLKNHICSSLIECVAEFDLNL